MLFLLLLPFWAVANSISTCCCCGVPKLANKYTWKRSRMYLLQATGNSTAQLHRNSWETIHFKSISSNFSWVSFTIYCSTLCISLPIHVPAAVGHSYVCVCVHVATLCALLYYLSKCGKWNLCQAREDSKSCRLARQRSKCHATKTADTHTHMHKHVCLGVFK